MKFTALVQARKALNPLWKMAWLRGRCWGLKLENNNPFFGSNILLASGKELVSVSQDPDGRLKVHEYFKTEDTLLGKAVKEALKNENLKVKEG